jgi:hypothetical protein
MRAENDSMDVWDPVLAQMVFGAQQSTCTYLLSDDKCWTINLCHYPTSWQDGLFPWANQCCVLGPVPRWTLSTPFTFWRKQILMQMTPYHFGMTPNVQRPRMRLILEHQCLSTDSNWVRAHSVPTTCGQEPPFKLMFQFSGPRVKEHISSELLNSEKE